MCLSIPGKVIEINKNGKCIVDYETEKRKATFIDDKIKINDYVVVSGGIVVMRIPKEQAEKFLEILK